MKRIQFFLILTLMSGCAWLTSCSDDKDDDSGSSNGNTCKIESVVFESIYESGSVYTDYYNDFKFDQSGNIISYALSIQDDYSYEAAEKKYAYSSSSISIIEDNTTTATYAMNDGRIVSAYDNHDNKWTYIYDSANKLVKIEEDRIDEEDVKVYDCKWQDGNIVSYTESYGDHSVEFAVSYTDSENHIGFMPVDALSGYLDSFGGEIMFDSILCAEGYFGVMPKNLPSKISSTDSYESLSISYSDFNKHGYPAKMTVVESGESQKYTYVWTMSWAE